MSFATITVGLSWINAATNIRRVSYCFKMFWVAAMSVSAFMIQFHSVRNGPSRKEKNGSVGCVCRIGCRIHSSIAARIQATEPKPATVAVDSYSTKQSSQKFLVFCHGFGIVTNLNVKAKANAKNVMTSIITALVNIGLATNNTT